MKAKVIAKTTVNNLPVKIGDIVEVNEITFRNLAKKGRLEAADKASEAVDLEEPSRIDQAEADARIDAAEKIRKAKFDADEAKKKAAK